MLWMVGMSNLHLAAIFSGMELLYCQLDEIFMLWIRIGCHLQGHGQEVRSNKDCKLDQI